MSCVSKSGDHHFVWYDEETYKCMFCWKSPNLRKEMCDATEHDYSPRNFCYKCGHERCLEKVEMPEIGLTWDLFLEIFSKRRSLLFGLACLQKNQPEVITSYVEFQKYIKQISSPLLRSEIPPNCGFSHTQSTLWTDFDGGEYSGGIVCSTRYGTLEDGTLRSRFKINHKGTFVHASRDIHIEELKPIRFIDRCGEDDTAIFWHLDVITLINLLVKRMQKHGKVNLQIAKNIVLATVDYLENEVAQGEHFLRGWLAMHKEKFGSDTLDDIRKLVSDYSHVEIKDTIPCMECSAVLLPESVN